MWDLLKQYISNELLSNKGVNWSGFGVFSFEVDQRDDAGIHGKKILRKPIFFLADDFSKCYGYHCPKLANTIPSHKLNYASLIPGVGYNRETTASVLKEVIRCIGVELVESKSKMVNELDCGVCKLVFEGNNCTPIWDTDFLKRIHENDEHLYVRIVSYLRYRILVLRTLRMEFTMKQGELETF
jgi:hypothetical protein